MSIILFSLTSAVDLAKEFVCLDIMFVSFFFFFFFCPVYKKGAIIS